MYVSRTSVEEYLVAFFILCPHLHTLLVEIHKINSKVVQIKNMDHFVGAPGKLNALSVRITVLLLLMALIMPRFDSLLAAIKPPKPILPEISFTVVAQMLRIPPLGAQVLIRATQVGVCAECVVSQAAGL